jgi:uroporphyrinogen-III synthase
MGGTESRRRNEGTQVQQSILLTRPADDSAATAARIEAMGYRPVIAPMLKIQSRKPSLPRDVQAILVTSSNALHALPPCATPLLAVGDATAARARATGFTHVRSAGRDAHALAELVFETQRPALGPLLLCSGARQGESLAAALRARGFRVIRRVCYAALPVQGFPAEAGAAIRSGELHAVLFLSAETAAVFVRLLPPELVHALASVTALAIGDAAAATLEPLPWRRVSRPQEPTLDAVLALI